MHLPDVYFRRSNPDAHIAVHTQEAYWLSCWQSVAALVQALQIVASMFANMSVQMETGTADPFQPYLSINMIGHHCIGALHHVIGLACMHDCLTKL